MRIGIYSNPEKDPDYRFARQTAALIQANGAVSIIDQNCRNTSLGAMTGVETAEYSTCDMIICLGGDGTFLSMIHLPGCEQIPVIGVNLGSVGFLTEIMPDNLENAVSQLIAGRFHLEQRMMLDVQCYDADHVLLEEGYALNDAVISRGGMSRILNLELTINQETIDRIPGDGLIVSTPTGSTAYSLSAGGPIIHPELNLLLINPICPHTLHNRSYIAADTSRVVVRICDYSGQALIAIDGRQEIYLSSNSTVVIQRSTRTLKVMRLGNDNFYAALPDKIQARGRTR